MRSKVCEKHNLSASIEVPNSDPRDSFFYTYITRIYDSYVKLCTCHFHVAFHGLAVVLDGINFFSFKDFIRCFSTVFVAYGGFFLLTFNNFVDRGT